MVISMFIIGMLPAVFAQEIIDVSDRVNVQAIDPAGIQQAPKPGVVNEPIVLRPISVGSGSVAGSGPTSTIGTVDATPVSIDAVDSDVEKTKRKRHIDGLFKKNKGRIKKIFRELNENYEEEKAIKFVTFAAHVNERSIDVLERMMERAEGSPKYLENHPDALEKMGEIREELYESYETFYGAVSDDSMSEEEYQALVPELREFGKKLNRFAKNDKVRAYAKNHREEITRNLKNRYGDNPKVRANIDRLENARDAKGRQAAMEDVRTSVIEVSSDRISVELSEDTPALV